ncbi:N-acetylmuramoyl-L-alanine amidase family protein [Globicatella sulfidifaciens]
MGKFIGIDIGHGEDTFETGGGKGLYKNGKKNEEHHFNSIVAKKLKPLLEKNGHKVTFGVQQPLANDQSLGARANKFNDLKVDILISVHANAVGNASVNGIASFYDAYDNWEDKVNSEKLSKCIMAEFKKQGQTIYTGGMGDGKGSIPSYVGSWTDFYMNRMTWMPSVLLELGFMTGDKDFDKIFGSQQDKYTTQMAEGIAAGVQAYYGLPNKPVVTNTNAKTYKVVKGDSLWEIAQQTGKTVADLKRINNLTSNLIVVGQVLNLTEPAKKEEIKVPTDETQAINLKDNQMLIVENDKIYIVTQK